MSALPLYRAAREARQNGAMLRAAAGRWTGHPGLWYEKFFDMWRDDEFEKIEDGAKQDWILSVVAPNRPADGRFPKGRVAATVCAGEEGVMCEFHARRRGLIETLDGFTIDLTLQSPFVTGLGYEHPIENGFLWHPVLGTPFLPGSSVKGLLRAWATGWADASADDIRRFFGGDDLDPRAGGWIFFDALPLAPVRLGCEVMTPHDGGWRISQGTAVTPSDWVSPNPIPFLVVSPGARFTFAFAPCRRVREDGGRDEKDDGRADIEAWLRDALDCLGVGGKTATGFGRFE